jgi:hypothetical protein
MSNNEHQLGIRKPLKRKKIKRVKKGGIYYFDEETQKNIENFQATNNKSQQETLYVKNIFPAFQELVENLICIYKFQGLYTTHDELKNDCIMFLYESLHKFDGSRGTKAFSYFNVVAKRWLITRSRKRLNNSLKMVSLDAIDHFGRQEYDKVNDLSGGVAAHLDFTVPSQDDQIITIERSLHTMNILYQMRNLLTSENDIKCLDSIITLFEKREDLPLLNKRAIFTYIRELSGLTPKQLTMSISSIKKNFVSMKNEDFKIF